MKCVLNKLSTKRNMQYQKEDRVKVELKVEKSLLGYPGRPGDYCVAVTGSGIQLGCSNPRKATRCQPIGHNIWVKDIWSLKNSDINFKCLVMKRCNGAIMDMEKTQQRCLTVKSKPIIVDVEFNKQRITVKEVEEQKSTIPPQNERTDSDILSNKALLQAHLKVTSQPKYSLSGNIETTNIKPDPFVIKEGTASILEKQEERIEQEEEMLTANEQRDGRDTTLATALTKRISEYQVPHERAFVEDTHIEDLVQKDNKIRSAEIVVMHKDTDEERAKDTNSTTTTAKYFPCIGRKFLLAAAGVAAVSYAGYYAFFRK